MNPRPQFLINGPSRRMRVAPTARYCKSDRDDPRLLQISVPLQPGNSGGALVDDRGNVVGITTGQLDALRMMRSDHSIPQNVNYAIKISHAQLLLENVHALSEKLPKPRATPQTASEAVEFVRRATAIVLASKE